MRFIRNKHFVDVIFNKESLMILNLKSGFPKDSKNIVKEVSQVDIGEMVIVLSN